MNDRRDLAGPLVLEHGGLGKGFGADPAAEGMAPVEQKFTFAPDLGDASGRRHFGATGRERSAS